MNSTRNQPKSSPTAEDIHLFDDNRPNKTAQTSCQRIVSRATAKYIRLSPSKLRRVLSSLRGLTFMDARLILAFLPYNSSRIIFTLLKSARANYLCKVARADEESPQKKNFQQTDPNTLTILSAFSDEGPVMRRVRPAARGRAMSFLRRTAHITFLLTNTSKILHTSRE